MKRRRILLYFLAANAIGVFFLWLWARNLPFHEIGPYLETTSLSHLVGWSVAFVGVYAVCHVARVVRWKCLVDPLGSVEARRVHRASTVGFAAILLLPFRLGEFVRPALLARRSDLAVSSLLATAVVERVIDGLFVTGLLFVTLLTYTGGHDIARAKTIGLVAGAIFIPAIAVCGLALWRRQWTLSLVDALVRPISEKIADYAEGLLDDFIDGFLALADGGNLANFLGLTTVYWTLNIVSMWLLAHYGFGFAVGPWETATIIAILVIGIMIPAGTGLTGTFEVFLKEGLALFVALEAVEGKVVVFTGLVHVLQLVVIVLPGIWVMWTDPAARHLLEISHEAQEQIEREESH